MSRKRTEAELSELRAASVAVNPEMTEYGFTCDDCKERYTCPYVFDVYNTDGDCLAEK